MRYWFRELGGWVFVFLGFVFFYLAYQLAFSGRLLQVWPIAIIGIFVFRGGIHLLKVAVAARICQDAQDRLYPVAPPSPSASLLRQPANPPLARRPGNP